MHIKHYFLGTLLLLVLVSILYIFLRNNTTPSPSPSIPDQTTFRTNRSRSPGHRKPNRRMPPNRNSWSRRTLRRIGWRPNQMLTQKQRRSRRPRNRTKIRRRRTQNGFRPIPARTNPKRNRNNKKRSPKTAEMISNMLNGNYATMHPAILEKILEAGLVPISLR